jgi:hypothetical protein
MATITYVTYKFNPPEALSEGDFNILKYGFTNTVGYDPFPKGGFFRTFKISTPIVGISLLAQTLWSFSGDACQTMAVVGMFLLFGCIVSGVFHSWVSYLGFMFNRRTFYRGLQKMIEQSETYEDYSKLSGRKWSSN